MAFVDRVSEYPGRIRLTNADTGEELGTFDVDRDEGIVSEPGTPLSAENLNTEIENTVAEAMDGLTITRQFTVFDSITIAGNSSSGERTANIAVQGYTPIAIRGYRVANNNCHLFGCYISGNSIVVYAKNNSSSSVTATCVVYIAYIKNI